MNRTVEKGHLASEPEGGRRTANSSRGRAPGAEGIFGVRPVLDSWTEESRGKKREKRGLQQRGCGAADRRGGRGRVWRLQFLAKM
ncbi:hypothetical protein GGI43DRAFT_400279, partial [Trichoderma evansii]